MTEEQVTKALLKWLMDTGWSIVCYDFPQSGTGVLLHPNESNDKNKDAINPDIVAVNGDKCVFFENKSYFYYPDFEKVNMLRTTDSYSNAISDLLKGYSVKKIYYGIGYPASVHKKKAQESELMTDFIIGVNPDYSTRYMYILDDKIFM